AATIMGLIAAAGCQHLSDPAPPPSVLTSNDTKHAKLTETQVADVQAAMGKTLQLQGQQEKAASAFQVALQHNPKQADASLALAVIHDKQGKFAESAALYQSALAARPGNPEVYCSVGYSFYLQSRWAEAEMNLRQAIAIVPDHRRAHNNLGLVLARTGRPDNALAEFRKAGCTAAEAHANLAYAQ